MRKKNAMNRSGSIVLTAFMMLPIFFAALAKAGEAQSPSLVVEEKAYHFGKVRQGDVIEHSFLIKNKGNGVLRIGRVKPG